MTTTDGLTGKGMQQTPEQWEARSRVLAESMAELIRVNRPRGATTALDVGCQAGGLVDTMTRSTGLAWQGIDPGIEAPTHSPEGSPLFHGFADDLPFDDQAFDVLLFANVFEHVLPDKRVASLVEMNRVMKPGGVVVGQIPNPYFFVESHSRLPFMGWLPFETQKKYWTKFANVPWEHDFFVVTRKHLSADAQKAGLLLRSSSNFNYPVEIYPESAQRAVRLLTPAMKRFPWAWQFVLVKPES